MGRHWQTGGRDTTGGPGEDPLEALLSAGLAELGERPVEVGDLLERARVGARRIRRRRRVAGVSALAVVVIGVPLVLVGTGLLGGPPGAQLANKEAGGSAAASSQLLVPGAGPGNSASGPVDGTIAGPGNDTSAPAGTRVSRTTAQVLSQDESGQYQIGDQALLQAADLAPIGVPNQSDDQASLIAAGPTPTPVCRTLPSASARAVAGRGATYTFEGDGWTVRLVVRVLPGTAAADEMDWLKRSMGYCAGELQLRRAAVSGLPGDGVVLGYQPGADPGKPKAVLVVGVVQQGRTTSAVELVVPATAGPDSSARVTEGLTQARRLLTLADLRLKSSGLVSAARDDPSLSA